MTVSYRDTGEIRIYALFCGGDKMDMAVFDPFDTYPSSIAARQPE